jgi:murein DD-endopeptidase MepM/ murein hydrolase activator NlpD
MKIPLYTLLCVLCLPLALLADTITIQDLQYTDAQYNALYESTIASKNRLLKKERSESYEIPDIYSYRLKEGEDIWTLIAKTSLTIDTIATLNRVDFIGMLKQDTVVFLPDTLGIFFEAEQEQPGYDTLMLSEAYDIPEEHILEVGDPVDENRTLFFLPEARLSFLERTYLTGVVFYAPLMGIETSKYGKRIDPFINEEAFHSGVDLASVEGKNVHAARWGSIVYADETESFGNTVVIKHEIGYYTLYGHLQEILVEVDENVESGQVIGKVGSTGRTTGPHLHFEIRREKNSLNPDNIPYFIESMSEAAQ